VEPLRGLGYWADADDWNAWLGGSELPHPLWLVRRGWRSRERRRILAYLRSGHVYAAYKGFSSCRFLLLCRSSRPDLGSCDLTDGEWVWPQGLAHYVERHAVFLPDAFIEAMRSRGWRTPPREASRLGEARRRGYDLSFWVAWGREHRKAPWSWIC
jgi:hypothetical protein